MHIRIGLLQHNPTINALMQNAQLIIDTHQTCDLLVCPEMALIGYPPQDLLFDNECIEGAQQTAKYLSKHLTMPCVLGNPVVSKQHNTTNRYNVAQVWAQSECIYTYYKCYLPNESVFDERRYFTSGTHEQSHWLWQVGGHSVRLAVCVCQDIWHKEYITQYVDGADILLCINASPFYMGRANERLSYIGALARTLRMPVLYVNSVGGQDELVFDGNSFACNSKGETVAHAGAWQQAYAQVTYDTESQDFISPCSANKKPPCVNEQDMLAAVCLGVQDYVQKTGNERVWIGLSGGIDSALTTYIACRALGADKVHAVMMPYLYTSELSVRDATRLADTLGIHYQVIAIEGLVSAFHATLATQLQQTSAMRDIALQNIQARIRSMLLMTLANLTEGSLVLTTSNKSELSMGYSTLYGDMAGAFNPLKDITKSQVFALCRFINQAEEIIPSSTINRPPSAELAPDQKDEDSLPAYNLLDKQLALLLDPLARNAVGMLLDTQQRTTQKRIQAAEFKRFQSPPGVRLSKSSLSRLEWRYPLAKSIS